MLRELRAENRSCRLVPHRCFRAGAVGERARAGRAEVRSRPDGIVVLLWKPSTLDYGRAHEGRDHAADLLRADEETLIEFVHGDTSITSFPVCSPRCIRTNAAAPSARGTTLSTTGQSRPSCASRTISANSRWLPIVDPRMLH